MKGETKAAAFAVDSLLHALVEQDAVKSIEKFSRYIIPKILQEFFTEVERQRRNEHDG
jgi:hypothetical protein